MLDSGKVACGCEDCGGEAVGLAEFEEHARVPDRLLTERIILADHGVSLKVRNAPDCPLPSPVLSQESECYNVPVQAMACLSSYSSSVTCGAA